MGKVRCPGSLKTTSPTIIERRCNKCGRVVEMFADEEKTECRCGNAVFKDRIPTCVVWCKSAEECMGDIIDVKKIKEEAQKNAEKEGNPQFASKLKELLEKKQQDCTETKTE